MEQLVLRTDRLTLRSFEPRDAESIALYANDRDIAQFLLKMPHPYTLADAKTFIEMQMAPCKLGHSFAICVEDEVVGSIGTVGEFGYWLGRKFWNQGIVTEASHAVLEHHFDVAGSVLKSSHAVANLRSGRVLEKCGFKYTGEEMRRVGVFEDQDHYHKLMVLTKASWTAHLSGVRT